MIHAVIADALEQSTVPLSEAEKYTLSREVSHSIDSIPAAEIISDVLDADVEAIRRILDDYR